MPIITSSADLRNKYNEISKQCHNSDEPVFITKNGRGDLAVMSIEAYDRMVARVRFYEQILDGIKDVQEGRVQDFEEAMDEIFQNRT